MTKGELLDIISGMDDDTEIYIDDGHGGVANITNIKIDYDTTNNFNPQIIIDYEV